MFRRPKLLSPFINPSLGRAIPERVQEVIERFEAHGERLIGWVQLAIGIFITLLYFIARRPTDAFMPFVQQPVPISLAIYVAFTLLRLVLSYRIRLPKKFLVLSMLVDIATLFGVIWYFHIQYGQSPGFYLKAPTIMYIFVFIAIRALRFDPNWVLAMGGLAALGWAGMTAYAVETSGMGAITRSYVDYIESDQILIGAEVDKVVAILALSVVLAVALTRAKRLLAVAVRDQIEREEIRRFLPEDVEHAITRAPTTVIAGDAQERDAAIVMLDIRGFSRFLHANDPQPVVAILVALHARIVPVIQRHGGVVDKYLGDGLLATFGATKPSQTPAADALHALGDIMAIADAWSAETATKFEGASLKVNGAVTSGKVVFTALGDELRLEYTVIGDAVNLAAKLEKHNKRTKSSALTTEATYQLARLQGYVSEAPVTHLASSRIQGVGEALDLVVLVA